MKSPVNGFDGEDDSEKSFIKNIRPNIAKALAFTTTTALIFGSVALTSKTASIAYTCFNKFTYTIGLSSIFKLTSVSRYFMCPSIMFSVAIAGVVMQCFNDSGVWNRTSIFQGNDLYNHRKISLNPLSNLLTMALHSTLYAYSGIIAADLSNQLLNNISFVHAHPMIAVVPCIITCLITSSLVNKVINKSLRGDYRGDPCPCDIKNILNPIEDFIYNLKDKVIETVCGEERIDNDVNLLRL